MANLMTAVLALLSSALWGSADYLGGTVSRRLSPVVVVGVSQTLALLLLVPAVLLLGAPSDPGGYLPWALAAGVVGPAALMTFYAALSIGTMGVVAPVAATGVVVPVAIGLFGGERPTGLQLIGIAAAVAGVVLASGPEVRAVETHEARGGARSLVLAGLAAVGFGLTLWLIAGGSASSVGMTLLVQRVTSVTLFVSAAVVVVWSGRPGRPGGPAARDLPVLLAVGAADVAANGLYALASRSGLLSVVSVLGSLYPVATALLARFLDDERLRPVQLVGVAVALVGVVLIGAGGA
ncbi:MAG: EamA family transporter [Actinomycetia bacterium]|nr:EamA family transporter [Actinomycetes bacterium]